MFICQLCKKAPATIHLTDIHNNVKKEVHVCEGCAKEKGFNLQGAANLPQLLGLAAKKAAPPSSPIRPKPPEVDLVCPVCGTTWSQFGERGRLGCPHDYQAFAAMLRPMIAGHTPAGVDGGGTLHCGKRPGPPRPEDGRGQLARSLEKKLRLAVAEENYEVAARLKNELDALRPG